MDIIDICKNDDVEQLKKFIEMTKDINSIVYSPSCNHSKGLSNNPPILSVAIFFTAEKIFDYLIDNDVDVDVPDDDDDYPIHFACKLENVDFLKILIRNGATVSNINHKGIYYFFKRIYFFAAFCTILEMLKCSAISLILMDYLIQKTL